MATSRPMGTKTNTIALIAAIAGTIILLVADSGEAATLVRRLAPIFVFVIGMSVVVNIASQVGVFDAVTRALERIAPASPAKRRHTLWAGLVLTSIVVTVFFFTGYNGHFAHSASSNGG